MERHMYSPEHIIWIKNIKRDKGNGWAYEDVSCSEPFLLNWPTSKKGSALTPRVGDIIVLFQKPNRVNNRKNYKVHVTHLVSPISEDLIVDDAYPDHKWCRRVELIAKANPIEAIPNPGYYNFFKPNRGLTNPIINLVNNIDLSEAETKDDIWRLFQDHFCSAISDQIFEPQDPVGIFGEVEGDRIIREHIKQEVIRRNSRVVQLAKDAALRAGNGRILCECCAFDFVQTYGEHGMGFIECHHKVHINTGQRITRIEDLALVCSNCHRMLHRKNANNVYFSVEELKHLISRSEELIDIL
jgi:hypothetical protein